MRRLALTFVLTSVAGCVVQDGNKQGEAPIWYPAFVVRDANTTQEWGGQNIYGQQTDRFDPKKESSIGSPGNSLPVNPPDSLVVHATSRVVAATNPYGEGLRPPDATTGHVGK